MKNNENVNNEAPVKENIAVKTAETTTAKRGRGRPKGSKNKPKAPSVVTHSELVQGQ